MPSICYLSTSRLHRDRANLIQTIKTAAALNRAGAQCSLFVPPWRGDDTTLVRRRKELHADNVPIRAVQFLHSRWPASWLAAFYGSRLRRYDAVYIRNPKLSSPLVSFGILHHLEIHSLRQLTKDVSLAEICNAHKQGQIGWLFPISRSAADGLVDAGADPSRIHIAPSGVDVELFARTPAFKPPTGTPRVLYAGTVSRDRGLDVLETVAASGAASVTLVGRLDTRCSPPTHCCYQPAVPYHHVPDLYADADYVLLPYQDQLEHADAISPIKLFEALATGRPIIASDLPPIREILMHERDALLVSGGDTSNWIDAINRLRNDPELALRLAQASRAAASRYSWEARARGILACLFPKSFSAADLGPLDCVKAAEA